MPFSQPAAIVESIFVPAMICSSTHPIQLSNPTAHLTQYSLLTSATPERFAYPNLPRFLKLDSGTLSTMSAEIPIEGALGKIVEGIAKYDSFKGGQESAIEAIKHSCRLKNYDSDRDYPALEATSHLSPHLKFGTCSIRQAYWTIAGKLGQNHPLIRQFYWRDFLTHIAFHFPHVFGKPFKAQYDGIAWKQDEESFQLWREGRTGFR